MRTVVVGLQAVLLRLPMGAVSVVDAEAAKATKAGPAGESEAATVVLAVLEGLLTAVQLAAALPLTAPLLRPRFSSALALILASPPC